jgi:hypothetical protein
LNSEVFSPLVTDIIGDIPVQKDSLPCEFHIFRPPYHIPPSTPIQKAKLIYVQIEIVQLAVHDCPPRGPSSDYSYLPLRIWYLRLVCCKCAQVIGSAYMEHEDLTISFSETIILHLLLPLPLINVARILQTLVKV